ncbi:trypsin-like peptidase domain-containing protein [Roseomonas eburnea]|uniref:Trypsin-like peptidase domain-containing protein n=1 Tax=Neoroseomonas eburnea TaxID=1346889 RepID=A0A9X9XBX6_9PROT|nr:serine protease [Neoroseomonas eburnea]MBR0681212.1 trypsin-like peptidase domain-containing protein [Neoroseomonas eburnea]
MRIAIPLLLLFAAGCAEPIPSPAEAPPPSADQGTMVTDYGGGSTPVARYIRLPDGRAVRVGPDGTATEPPAAAAPPGTPGATGKPAPGGDSVAEDAPAAPRRAGRPIGSGSAFAVTTNGLAVTNAHVVQGCSTVVDERGRRVRVIAADRRRDLALIDTGRRFESVVPFRSQTAVDLGETVLVFGFPYGQALGTGINVTNGIVTGLVGPGGDASRFQMNAAVQPGNSGGPAVDDAGMLLGVAVGRLNDLAVLRATGSLPQGINFAIRASEVERFLVEQGVQPERSRTAGGTGARAVSAAVAPAVFQVLCRG